jgi:hypothetical protein
MREVKVPGIDADMVVLGVKQKGLRIHSATEMIVQVASLGHAGEECVKRQWTSGARLFHCCSGLLFRRGGPCRSRKKLKQKNDRQSKLREAVAIRGHGRHSSEWR